MIEKLTQEQEEQLIKHREEYLRWGLSCEPINKELAILSISKMYSRINKKRPYFWICDSPLQIQLVIHILKKIKLDKGANLGANLWANLRDNLRDNLWANLWANLRDNLWANLRDNLGDNLWANLRDNLGDNLWANLRDNLGDNLRDNLEANLRDNLWANLRDNLGDNLGDNLEDNLWANLRDNLEANLRANLRDNLRDNLGDNLWANLRDNLGDNLGANLWANLRDNLWANLRANLVATNLWGQQDMYWICYYQYPSKFLGLDYKEMQGILNLWDDIGRSCSWWCPYENICFISDRPKEIHKNSLGQLHKDGSPALLFRDGYCLWMLNGVAVPEYLVTTPEGQLDIEFFKKQTNADIKAQFILKFGIERMASMGKSVDKFNNYSDEWWTKSEYELIDMSPIFTRSKYTPYLRMRNLTTGIWHLEGVHPDCHTIQDALNFRAKNRVFKIAGIN